MRNHVNRFRPFGFPAFWTCAPLLLLLGAQTLPASTLWNISLTAEDNDGGIAPTYAMVGGSLAYNSNNPGLGTGAGPTVNVQPTPTTTYSNPTALGLVLATSSLNSSNDNDGNPWCIPSGCVSGTLTASALATADLAAGSVGVSADSDIIGNSLAESSAGAEALMTDQLQFLIGDATASTTTDIGVSFTISGTPYPGAPLQPGVAGPSVQMNGGLSLGSGDITYAYSDSAGAAPDGVVNLDNGWVTSQILSQTPGSFVFNGVYQLTGASATLPITLQLSCAAQNGGTCDFANTAAVSFTLPGDVTFTSASGVFLTQPPMATPEPGSAEMLLCGLALSGLALLMRRSHVKGPVAKRERASW